MAKRTLGALADLIEDRVDKPREDATFNTFVENMLVLTLQEIIAEVPYARWLFEEHSITQVADQQYVVLPSTLDIDAIVSMRDDTNNRKVTRISAEDADRIDPGRDLSGKSIFWWFQRVGGEDRLYFLFKPDATDSLTLISGELITDPTSNQTTVLPAKYESWWMEGAMAKLHPRIEVDVTVHRSIFNHGLSVIKKHANSDPGSTTGLLSHRRRVGTTGVQGLSFPSNFDILP